LKLPLIILREIIVSEFARRATGILSGHACRVEALQEVWSAGLNVCVRRAGDLSGQSSQSEA